MRLRQLPVMDSVTRDGETVVMVDGRVILLSKLASAALKMIDGVAGVEEISAGLVHLFGDPAAGDAIGSTLATLEELAAIGLVALEE